MRIAVVTIVLVLVLVSVNGNNNCSSPLARICACEERLTGLHMHCVNGNVTQLLAMAAESGDILEKLSISNCSQPLLGVVPRISVRSLELELCNISRIEEGAFINLAPFLEELVLANNSLRTVPSLGALTKLISLNLNGNKLTDIAEGALTGLNRLRYLRVENNTICTLSSNSTSEVKGTLELLDLSGNCLSAIPAQPLRGAQKLMYLDLSENRITDLGSMQLMNLPVLKELRLSDNKIRTIHSMALMNVPQLQLLYMRNNLLTVFEPVRLQAFRQLELLDLSGNQLTKLASMKDLSKLLQLRVDDNRIEKIETLTFSANRELRLISLQQNRISSIARNAFDSMDGLTVLLLTNNSISSIDRGMLDGMKSLQQLSLRGNEIVVLENRSFDSVRALTSLDLAGNKINRIAKDTFAQLTQLFWLDLSNNRIERFEKDTFIRKIANILLDGNPLYCDEKMNWLVDYLVKYRVRTFLPMQPEVTCSGPEKLAGTRLKELMMKRANETMTDSGFGHMLETDRGAFLGNLIPGMGRIPALGNTGLAGMPVLGAITQAIPSLRNIPGIGPLKGGNLNLDNAIEQFAGPLVRFATGGQPVTSDLEQLLSSIPKLINIPGFGNVDISKLPPETIAHVLRGGQIPGLSKEALDTIVHQYMRKMAETAEAARKGHLNPADASRFLPPMDKLPTEMVTSVIRGDPLPGLSVEQTAVIKDYYTSRMPIEGQSNAASGGSALKLTPEVLNLLKMMPPGYNLSRVPKEVIEAVAEGRMPDLRLLPADLIEHLKANGEQLFGSMSNANVTLEEILKNLPVFDRPAQPTFSPYDINMIDNELRHEGADEARMARLRLYTAIALGLVGAVSMAIVAYVFIRSRRASQLDTDSLVLHQPAGSRSFLNSTPLNVQSHLV